LEITFALVKVGGMAVAAAEYTSTVTELYTKKWPLSTVESIKISPHHVISLFISVKGHGEGWSLQ